MVDKIWWYAHGRGDGRVRRQIGRGIVGRLMVVGRRETIEAEGLV